MGTITRTTYGKLQLLLEVKQLGFDKFGTYNDDNLSEYQDHLFQQFLQANINGYYSVACKQRGYITLPHDTDEDVSDLELQYLWDDEDIDPNDKEQIYEFLFDYYYGEQDADFIFVDEWFNDEKNVGTKEMIMKALKDENSLNNLNNIITSWNKINNKDGYWWSHFNTFVENNTGCTLHEVQIKIADNIYAN